MYCLNIVVVFVFDRRSFRLHGHFQEHLIQICLLVPEDDP